MMLYLYTSCIFMCVTRIMCACKLRVSLHYSRTCNNNRHVARASLWTHVLYVQIFRTSCVFCCISLCMHTYIFVCVTRIMCACILCLMCACILCLMCACILCLMCACILCLMCACILCLMCACILCLMCACILCLMCACILCLMCACILCVYYVYLCTCVHMKSRAHVGVDTHSCMYGA